MTAAIAHPSIVRKLPLPTRPRSILVADGQPDVVEALRLLLENEGFRVRPTSSARALLEDASAYEHDLVLMDVSYARSTGAGEDLLGRLREIDPALPIVVTASWGSIDGAVDAVRRGARDYVQKPWDPGRLVATVRKEAEFGATLRRTQRLEEEASRQRSLRLPALIAQSPSMASAVQSLERVATTAVNVVIGGERGTGKDVVARWIHDSSDRASRPFVAVDAGTLTADSFEREMFGQSSGGTPGIRNERVGCLETADGGTLFIAEVGLLSLSHQARVARALQTREVRPAGSLRTRTIDVRVLASTTLDLAAEVQAGRFRRDLFDLIKGAEVVLPALRERALDLLPLAQHFLERLARLHPHRPTSFSADAIDAMRAHSWPGNVRELELAIERALLVAREGTLTASDLGLNGAPRVEAAPPADEVVSLDQVEVRAIQNALTHTRGSVNKAAVLLGLSRSALYRRLQHHGITSSGTLHVVS